MTQPDVEGLRSKMANTDSVFLRAIEGYRSAAPQPEVIKAIEDYKAEVIAIVAPIAEAIRATDPEKYKRHSVEDILKDEEIFERFRQRFFDVFKAKVRHNKVDPTNVEQCRMIGPAASTKSMLIGAIKVLNAAQSPEQEEST